MPADTSAFAASKAFFPHAENFTYILVGESRHAVNFHYAAQQAFRTVHDSIDEMI